jgi:hypothetical protein
MNNENYQRRVVKDHICHFGYNEKDDLYSIMVEFMEYVNFNHPEVYMWFPAMRYAIEGKYKEKAYEYFMDDKNIEYLIENKAWVRFEDWLKNNIELN